MSLNLFIAVVCLVAAILLTIMTIRFFFANRTQEHTSDHHFIDQPTDAHVRAGDTLRTRRSDNQASLSLLTKQVIVSAVLTLLVIIPTLLKLLFPNAIPEWLVEPWLQAIAITPVMFYGGYPIHIDGWEALRHRIPNMNSLASISAIAAYTYGLVVCLAESSLPVTMQEPYFEVTGVIITLVLFARWGIDMWLPRHPAFPLQLKVDRFSRIWVPIAILIALWTFVGWLIFGPSPSLTPALLMGISVLIIACPVVLSWAAPLSASAAIEAAQRAGLIIRTTGALQQAQRIHTVVIASSLASHAQQVISHLQASHLQVITLDFNQPDALQTITTISRDNGVVAVISDGSESINIRNSADIAIVCTRDSSNAHAYEHADVISTTMDCSCILQLMHLSKAMMRNIQENLGWAFIFNLVGIPIAAGILYPFTGWMLNPMLACVAMILSAICVACNAWRLTRYKLTEQFA